MSKVVGSGSVHSTSLLSCPRSGLGMRKPCLRKFLKPAPPFSSEILPPKERRRGNRRAPVVAVLKKMPRVDVEVLPVSPEDVIVV